MPFDMFRVVFRYVTAVITSTLDDGFRTAASRPSSRKSLSPTDCTAPASRSRPIRRHRSPDHRPGHSPAGALLNGPAATPHQFSCSSTSARSPAQPVVSPQLAHSPAAVPPQLAHSPAAVPPQPGRVRSTFTQWHLDHIPATF